jgi:ribosomal protein S18 acetylase RimI-like enzyme
MTAGPSPGPPRRLAPSDPDLAAAHALIRGAFAGIAPLIDPPSSVERMTVADLREAAATGELWAIGTPPLACALLTPKGDALYLGRLAVSPKARRRGLARALLDHAALRAQALGLARVTLGCRVELAANHALFRSMGFHETHRETHPGYDRPTSVWFERPA